MVRSVVEGGLSPAAAAYQFHTTPRPSPNGSSGSARKVWKDCVIAVQTPFIAKPNSASHVHGHRDVAPAAPHRQANRGRGRGIMELFWRTFVECSSINPAAVKYIFLLMALYLHLGPFARWMATRWRPGSPRWIVGVSIAAAQTRRSRSGDRVRGVGTRAAGCQILLERTVPPCRLQELTTRAGAVAGPCRKGTEGDAPA